MSEIHSQLGTNPEDSSNIQVDQTTYQHQECQDHHRAHLPVSFQRNTDHTELSGIKDYNIWDMIIFLFAPFLIYPYNVMPKGTIRTMTNEPLTCRSNILSNLVARYTRLTETLKMIEEQMKIKSMNLPMSACSISNPLAP